MRSFEDEVRISSGRELLKRKLDAILATAARLLVRQQQITAASILANARPKLEYLYPQEHRDFGIVVDTSDYWRLDLAIPADVYFTLEQRSDLERAIDGALGTATEPVSDSDFIKCRIVTSLEEDPDWRHKTRQFISGEGITNQGRVRSDNIAARQHEGLLFRSRPEILFYDALKKAGIPFAPLSVVLSGGIRYNRIEPDFIIYKDGIMMIVEIDGDLYHLETPAAAHARLKFLLDEGAKLERVTASECDTPEQAREVVARVIATIDKLRGFPPSSRFSTG
jgi:hypothetical protein